VSGNRLAKQAHVRNGTVHQILVYDGDECVGWCQYGLPAELPNINNPKAYAKGLGEMPDWRIGCIFTGSGHRRSGVARAALGAALAAIHDAGGGLVEAYPEQVENLALVAERCLRYTTAASDRRTVAAGRDEYPVHVSLRGRDDQCSVAAGGSGLARRPAVDEAEDAVFGWAEAGVQPEWPGQRVSGVEIDRDPLVAMVMGPGERGIDERVPDAFPARGGRRGGGADVGLAVGAQPRPGEVSSMVSRPTSCPSRVARRWTAPASRRARCSATRPARGRSWRGANIGGAERCWSSIRAKRAMVSRSPAPAIRTAAAEEPRRGAAGWMP
jgi:hypothetical protein